MDEDDDLSDIADEELEQETKKKEIILGGDDRITEPIMTKYEYVHICGVRAKQISLGAKKLVNATENMAAKEVAMLELEFKMVGLKIKRPLPNNKCEIWKVSELEIPNLFKKVRE